MYYTLDHEWIQWQGQVAYVGICTFKLTGIRQIQRVEFQGTEGIRKRGEVLAVLQYEVYDIPVHMPVDGEVLGFNEQLTGENRDGFLELPEQNKWVALIFPSIPTQGDDLLSPDQYLMKNKRII